MNDPDWTVTDEQINAFRAAEELRTQWQGKNIRTERPIAEDEAPKWLGAWSSEDWHPDYKFGGAGVATDFVERGGEVFVQNDEGMEWVIDDRTLICDNIWDTRTDHDGDVAS